MIASAQGIANNRVIAIQQTIGDIVTSYNEQDFKKMQRPWATVGRLVLSKKMLRAQFGPYYEKWGPAEIDTIIFRSEYSVNAHLRFPQHPEQRDILSFYFKENGKIMGMGFGYPDFYYQDAGGLIIDGPLSDQMTSDIDSIIDAHAEDKGGRYFSGCVLLHNSKGPLYQQCHGTTTIPSDNQLDDNSMFLLASCSKQFTAMAIMMLAEKDQLNYDDPVQKHLPIFPYEDITILHLLTHTSGLPDYISWYSKKWDPSIQVTNELIFSHLVEQKPKVHFKVNEAHQYSNTNYVLLSLILTKVSGLSYGDFLKSHVFDPLGMKRTVVIARRTADSIPTNYAYGYVYDREHKTYVLPDSMASSQMVSYMGQVTGDDGVSTCIQDLRLWNQAINNHTLIRAETMRRAITPHVLNNGQPVNYGFGFSLRNGDGLEPVIFHTGGWPGYSTINLYLPERDLNIMVLSNNGYGKFTKMTDAILFRFLEP